MVNPDSSAASERPLPQNPNPSSHALEATDKRPTTSTFENHDSLVKGFQTITLAAGFAAAIQSQLMSTTIGVTGSNETIAFRAINAFNTSGLILDVLAAMLGYITGRWLERLTKEEKKILEEQFAVRNTHGVKTQGTSQKRSILEFVYYTWMAMSLFASMPLLVIGVTCMMAGLYTYIWTQHATAVAIVVTLAGGSVVPFIIGDFYIGKKNLGRRRKLIHRLSELQGDW